MSRLPFRWQFAPAWQAMQSSPLLLGPHGLRLDEWLAAGEARVVKHAPHRTVYRVVLPGQDFFVKHYRGDRKERLRSLFRPSKARAEYALTCETARRGVPTLEALGFGESTRADAPESFLLTRTLADAVPLADYLESTLPRLPGPEQGRVRRALAEGLGAFLAGKHRAGLLHHDLHPGNLLVRFAAGGRVELFLIDLHAVRLGPPLPWPASLGNLVILNRWFALRCSRADRRRAWGAYCAARDDLRLDERCAARRVEQATHTSFVRFAHTLDRRCLGGNRHFRKFRGPGVVGYATADLDPAALEALLAAGDGLFDDPRVRVLKKSRSSAVVETEASAAGRVRRVICKRFNATAWSDPLAALLRPTGALRSWVLGHGLRFRGLPTPRPLAVWHRTRMGLPTDGYLLMEKAPDAVELPRFVRSLDAEPPAERRRRLRALLAETAGVVRMMHERNVSHRDLKAPNLLVSPADWTLGYRGLCESAHPGGRRDRVWLVDLVGVRRHGRLGRARRVQNLARLNTSFLVTEGLTRSDRLRFLRTYLGWGLYGREGWKPWWKEVEARTREKVERNRRSGRVLG